MKIDVIQPSAVDAQWKHIQPYLEKGCARTGWTTTPAVLWQQCRAGGAVYIVARNDDDGVRWSAVVGFEENRKGGIAYIKALGAASIDDWSGDFAEFTVWANSIGASFVRFDGPRAYQKQVPNARFLSATYEVEISQ